MMDFVFWLLLKSHQNLQKLSSFFLEVVNDSGSGPGADEKFEDIEPSDKGSGSGEDLPPTAEEFEDEDEKETDSGSGSSGDKDDDDSEGDDLAKGERRHGGIMEKCLCE